MQTRSILAKSTNTALVAEVYMYDRCERVVSLVVVSVLIITCSTMNLETEVAKTMGYLSDQLWQCSFVPAA